MQVAASRAAEEVDELRGGYEDRMSAMRAELQQQEVDKAALLDIVQVGGLRIHEGVLFGSLVFLFHMCCILGRSQAFVGLALPNGFRVRSANQVDLGKQRPADCSVTV